MTRLDIHTNFREDDMTSKLDKLKQQQEKINKAIRREQTALKKKQRADDTRRKILDGALIRNYADTHPEIQTLLDTLREKELTRDDDRKLFGLEPLPKQDDNTQNKTVKNGKA